METIHENGVLLPKREQLTPSVTQNVPELFENNIKDIQLETEWFTQLVSSRMHDEETPFEALATIPTPEASNYAKFILEHKLTLADRVLLFTALISSKTQKLLTNLLTEPLASNPGEQFDHFKVVFDKENGICKPTVSTVAYIMAGEDHLKYAEYLFHFEQNSTLIKERIVSLISPTDEYESFPSHIIRLDPAYESHFCRGSKFRLDQVKDFHARLAETTKGIKDLILNDKTQLALMGLIDYMRVSKVAFENDSFSSRHNKGFVAMFHGFPGTGKTYSAAVIANEIGLPMYIVDTAGLVSKYVGETSKNLKNIFDRLKGKNCILYFDEADAIFGKRTVVKDSKDRYGNQEVSYLLQAIEKFDGIVILSSNFPDNVDMAFRRRINLMVNFEPPEEDKRLKLWQYYYPDEGYTLEPENLLEKLASRYSLTGANIANLMKSACIEAVANGNHILTEELMDRHLSSEYYKDGRNLNDPHAFSWEKMKGMG